MTWRRIAPWVILVTLLLAVFIDLPRQTLGLTWLPTNVAGVQLRTVLGLDLQGGIRVTLAAEPEPGSTVTDDQLATARDIIERRVGGLGVSEPQVRTEVSGDGTRRIVVEVPGVSNEEQVRSLVGSTGQLQFVDPAGQTLTDGQDISTLIADGTIPVLFDGGNIDPASVAPTTQSGSLAVVFTLRSPASETWCNYTTSHQQQPGPIALDGKVITTPTIQGPICGGTTVITVGASNRGG